jgi:hypothetical protein
MKYLKIVFGFFVLTLSLTASATTTDLNSCIFHSRTGLVYSLSIHYTSDTLANVTILASMDRGATWLPTPFCVSTAPMTVSGGQSEYLIGRMKCTDNTNFKIAFSYNSGSKIVSGQHDMSSIIDNYQCP